MEKSFFFMFLFTLAGYSQTGVFTSEPLVFMPAYCSNSEAVQELKVELDDVVDDVDFILRRLGNLDGSSCPLTPTLGKTILHTGRFPEALFFKDLDITIKLPAKQILGGLDQCELGGSRGEGKLCLYAKEKEGGRVGLVAESSYRFNTVPRRKTVRTTTELTADEAALFRAIENRNIAVVKELLTKGVDVDARQFAGAYTPLMYISNHFWDHSGATTETPESIEIARLLVEAGADTEAELWSGLKPLALAANRGNLGIVGVLLKYGADPKTDPAKYADSSPLAQAVNGPHYSGCEHGSSERRRIAMVQLLLKHGVDIKVLPKSASMNDYVTWSTSQCLSTKMLELVLHETGQKGALKDVTAFHAVHWYRYFQKHEANLYSKFAVLIANGANIDSKNDLGRTSLHWASARRCEWLIKLLLKHGASKHVRDHQGNTPYDLALHTPKISAIIESDSDYPKGTKYLENIGGPLEPEHDLNRILELLR